MINWDQQNVDSSKMISLEFTTLGLSGKQSVRNLWSQKDLGSFDGKFETKVNQHGVTLVKLTAVK